MSASNKLIALDAKTGKQIVNFGEILSVIKKSMMNPCNIKKKILPCKRKDMNKASLLPTSKKENRNFPKKFFAVYMFFIVVPMLHYTSVAQEITGPSKAGIQRANDYPEDKRDIPMSWPFHDSEMRGQNYVFGIDIVIEKPVLTSKAIAAACYICGGAKGFGGSFYNNRITTNALAASTASAFYGVTANIAIIRSSAANAEFKPFRMGSKECHECVAKNVEFRSNDVQGAEFDVQATEQDHRYSVHWTSNIKVANEIGSPVKNAEVFVRDRNGSSVAQAKTDEYGKMKTALPGYSVNGKEKKYTSPYIVAAGGIEKKIALDKNTTITFIVSPEANKQSVSQFYSMKDYYAVEKYDVHFHAFTYDTSFIEKSKENNFRLLSINGDAPGHGLPTLEEQQEISVYHLKKFPGWFAYATAFKAGSFNKDDWQEKTLAHLDESFKKGAIAVKVWKNIGMDLKDKDGKFVMIDDPRFDTIWRFLIRNNITLIGHIGEPKNCWLPIEKMTVQGDKDYFSKHPEFHMYFHPEYPSYDDLIDSRDRLLEKHPELRFVGAHLGSLEWSVDELAKRLDKYPNMAVDMAERISHFQYQALTDWQKVHDFFIKYQDRLLYGTDISPSWVNHEEAHAIRLRHWKFFTSDEIMQVPKVTGEFRGLHLPREVIDKIYRENAAKWFPQLKKN